ncbi:MAG: hypothetical protein ACYDA4_04615 [Ignavibacteriaceae bacterium]
MNDIIDISGLPEEEVKVLEKLVELLRRIPKVEKESAKKPEKIEFLSKPMGKVKGTLSRKEIYDYL